MTCVIRIAPAAAAAASLASRSPLQLRFNKSSFTRSTVHIGDLSKAVKTSVIDTSATFSHSNHPSTPVNPHTISLWLHMYTYVCIAPQHSVTFIRNLSSVTQKSRSERSCCWYAARDKLDRRRASIYCVSVAIQFNFFSFFSSTDKFICLMTSAVAVVERVEPQSNHAKEQWYFCTSAVQWGWLGPLNAWRCPKQKYLLIHQVSWRFLCDFFHLLLIFFRFSNLISSFCRFL